MRQLARRMRLGPEETRDATHGPSRAKQTELRESQGALALAGPILELNHAARVCASLSA